MAGRPDAPAVRTSMITPGRRLRGNQAGAYGRVMHLRRKLMAPLAVLIALLLLLGLPLAAEASVGVGIQAGPVRLGSVAHAGQSYSLPSVYVVNTGTETETVSLRVERLSHGPGRAVPPSWIQVAGHGVQLQAHQSAQIPLQLVLPGSAQRGRYLSDIVAGVSGTISVGQANLCVAAATKLVFRVVPGAAQGFWPAVPASSAWILGSLLLLAVAVFGFRRSGLRIRVERKTAGPGAEQQGGHHVA